MPHEQHHAGRGLLGLCLAYLVVQFIELMAKVFSRTCGLRLGPKHGHAGPGDLCQHRRWAHFIRTYQPVRAQAQNAFGGQLALITNTGQCFQGGWMLAGGIDADQPPLSAQRDHPLAQGTASTDPTA